MSASTWAYEDGFVDRSVKKCVWTPLLLARPILKSSIAALPRTRRMVRCLMRLRRLGLAKMDVYMFLRRRVCGPVAARASNVKVAMASAHNVTYFQM